MSDVYTGPSASEIAHAVQCQLSSDFDSINSNIDMTHARVVDVEERVDIVDNKLREIENELLSFVREQRLANRLGQAETRIGTIRQKLEKEFGHYDVIRRSLIGILEASDLAIVRKNTITTASENLFISTPHYWLAPCLVALAAWINDNEELAKTAVKEALKRNTENSSLFFALVTRRAERLSPSLQWIHHYLSHQNEESLNRNALVVIEALVCGIWGNDAEGVISSQIRAWVDKLESRENFYENQVEHWKAALKNMTVIDDYGYTYIKEYSPTSKIAHEVLHGARLHSVVREYFRSIFDKRIELPDFKTLLDEALTRLVTNYDDEEMPLREEEQLESLVIKFHGDESRAMSVINSEKELFAPRKNFLQLLLDAAMHPDTHDVNAAVSKFALALCKYYIYDAYNDLAAENRAKLPSAITILLPEITFSVNHFDIDFTIHKYKVGTKTGKGERTIVSNFNDQLDNDLEAALNALETHYKKAREELKNNRSAMVIGCVMLFVAGIPCLFIVTIIGAICLILAFITVFYIGKTNTSISELDENYKKGKASICKKFDSVQDKSEQVLRATCAEIVDYYEQFHEMDSKAEELLNYIESLEGNEYIHVPATRRHVLNEDLLSVTA